MKTVAILLLLLIVASLFSGLFFLYRDRGTGERTARALTIRVGLSVGLFALLMLAFATGLYPAR